MRTIRRTNQQQEAEASASSVAARRLLHEGFNLPHKPDFAVPHLPDDVGELDDGSLMELYTQCTAWAGFMNTRLGAAEVDEHEAEAALNYVLARLLVENWTSPKDDRITVAKAERETNPEVIDKRDKWMQAKAYRKMLQTLFENTERSAALLSRELTRRTAPLERRRNGP